MDDQQYQAVRSRVIRRFVLRLSFVINLLFFVLVMLQLALDIRQTPENMVGAAFFVLIWGAILLLHGSLAFNLFGSLIDRATRRELERERQQEKPKRHQLELDEDGELVEITGDWQADVINKREN